MNRVRPRFRETILAKTTRRIELLNDDTDHELPATVQDCRGTSRPCPLVSCQFNTYLDASPKTGFLRFNWPGSEPWEVPGGSSCVLDIAEEPRTLEDIGDTMNMTREGARLIAEKAATNFAKAAGPELMGAFREILIDAEARSSIWDQVVPYGDGDGRGRGRGRARDRRRDVDCKGLSPRDLDDVERWGNEMAALLREGRTLREAQEIVHGYEGDEEEVYPVVRFECGDAPRAPAPPSEASKPRVPRLVSRWISRHHVVERQNELVDYLRRVGPSTTIEIARGLGWPLGSTKHRIARMKRAGAICLTGATHKARWEAARRNPGSVPPEPRHSTET